MIVVTGLPRSGSMSVYQALTELGYKTLFYCSLTQTGTDWIGQDIDECDAVVDWGIAGVIDYWLVSSTIDHVVFLTRQRGWENSLDNLGIGKEVLKEYMCNLNFAIQIVKKKNIPHIILDITNNPRWDDLCRFLHKPIPDTAFPHLNQSNFNYSI